MKVVYGVPYEFHIQTFLRKCLQDLAGGRIFNNLLLLFSDKRMCPLDLRIKMATHYLSDHGMVLDVGNNIER